MCVNPRCVPEQASSLLGTREEQICELDWMRIVGCSEFSLSGDRLDWVILADPPNPGYGWCLVYGAGNGWKLYLCVCV